jgi:hypothetical protein
MVMVTIVPDERSLTIRLEKLNVKTLLVPLITEVGMMVCDEAVIFVVYFTVKEQTLDELSII